jgi:hypothetical protein
MLRRWIYRWGNNGKDGKKFHTKAEKAELGLYNLKAIKQLSNLQSA